MELKAIVKKAIEGNGIDELTDDEYNFYKSQTVPTYVTNAINNGIDALSDDEYKSYTSWKDTVQNVAPTKPSVAPAQPTLGETSRYNKENGVASPFVYTARAKYPMDANSKKTTSDKARFNKGDLIDQMSLDTQMDVNDVANKWREGDSWVSTFPPDSYEVTMGITSDPNVISKYMSDNGLGNSDMAFIAPRTARNMIQGGQQPSISNITTKAAAHIGDVFSAPGRAIGSLFTNDVNQGLGDIYGDVTVDNPVAQGIQGIIRDPVTVMSAGMAGTANAALKAPALMRTTALASRVAPWLKRGTMGAFGGLAETGASDILNDYATGEDNIGLENYAVGGALGSVVPSLYGKSKDFLANNEWLNSKFKWSTPYNEVAPNFGRAMEDKVVTSQTPTRAVMLADKDVIPFDQGIRDMDATKLNVNSAFDNLSDLYSGKPNVGGGIKGDGANAYDFTFNNPDGKNGQYFTNMKDAASEYMQPNKQFFNDATIGDLLKPDETFSRTGRLLNKFEQAYSEPLNKIVPPLVNPLIGFANWLRQAKDVAKYIPVQGTKILGKTAASIVSAAPLRIPSDANVAMEWFDRQDEEKKLALMNQYKNEYLQNHKPSLSELLQKPKANATDPTHVKQVIEEAQASSPSAINFANGIQKLMQGSSPLQSLLSGNDQPYAQASESAPIMEQQYRRYLSDIASGRK